MNEIEHKVAELIEQDIADFLNDRCGDGWAVTASKAYGDDELTHKVTITFKDGRIKFEASFEAWLENGDVFFKPIGNSGEGESIHDLLWQWLFWQCQG